MKNYYLFKGQNATTGKPNPTTGKMSYYGELLAFSTKQARDEYHENFYNHSNPSEFTKKCSRTTARGYFLGMSVDSFKEYLKLVDFDAL